MRRPIHLLTCLAVLSFPVALAAQPSFDVEPAVAKAAAKDAVVADDTDAEAAETEGEAPMPELPPGVELSPEVLGKLSPDQVARIVEDRELTRRKLVTARHQSAGPEIFASLGFFLMVILVVLIPLYFAFRKNRHLHETLRAMIDKGVEIPVELITPQRPKQNDLRRGLVFATAGLGLSIFLALLEGVPTGVWACGVIPMLIGCGYLIAWWLQRKDNGEQTAPRG